MRRRDLSGPKLLDHCVTCYNCQKKAQKETVQFVSETPGEKYQGNLEVRSRKQDPVPTVEFIMIILVTQENGKCLLVIFVL